MAAWSATQVRGAGGWHFVVKYSEHKLNVQCHLFLGESGGWYAKETPGGARGDTGAVATAWPDLPDSIRTAILAFVEAIGPSALNKGR